MNTSYFAKSAKHPNAVSICAQVPPWYTGRQYKRVAPTWSIFSDWKRTGDKAIYTKRFEEEVLSPLDPFEIYEEIGENSIMICYEAYMEKTGRLIFCHRHIVARWLSKATGKIIREIGYE